MLLISYIWFDVRIANNCEHRQLEAGVKNETNLISAKNCADLSNISEVRSYITEWPHFFGPLCIRVFLGNHTIVVCLFFLAATELIDVSEAIK